jgi:Domain of unknown function (DUF5979)
MRGTGRTLLSLLVVMSGPVAIAITATPASAGLPLELTVTKLVQGPAPPGAQYLVDIDCEDVDVQPSSQLTFTGPGSQTVEVSGGGITCTVVESVTSGATVTYACEVTEPEDETACESDNAVFYDPGGGEAAATITVTNRFLPEPPPPGPSVAPVEPPAAEPVTAAARFTG